MKRTFAAAAILSAAWLAVPAVPTALAAPAATQPASGQTDVPVKQVVLFSSGVGYFEHFGSVRDNGATELRFKTDQINDVLKSLVLQDLDRGSVGAVTYPSQEPIEKTLKSFQVNITNNPPLADLLNQLRGAKITVSSKEFAEQELKGTIVGVEKRQERVAGADGKTQIVETWVLNLKVGHRFHAVPMTQIKDFSLEDPKLEEELDKALSALAQSRDQDKKPVSINFRGQGERRVRIGYVVETPIWKTSYRLILDGVADRGPATRPAAGAAISGPGPGSGAIAGAPTAEQIASLKAETEVLHSWVNGAAPQYGESHPSVAFLAARAKAIDEALKKGVAPKPIEPPEVPKDAVARRELEDELEVHKQWYDGMANGYGVNQPAIVTVRTRIQQLEQVLGGGAVQAAAKVPAAAPGAPADKGGAAATGKAGKLQGWAIIENQTDNDWNDVQLSLVSGRPLSYIQDLYHPLYIPRPVVFPNLYASLRPQTYQGGITEKEEQALNERRNEQQNQAQNRSGGRAGGGGGAGGGAFGGANLFGSGGNQKAGEAAQAATPAQPLDPTASVVSAASAAQLGELFEYTVGNVSLPRQRSAMIPIVTDDIDVEKVSIYNADVLATHPLNGAKVKNTTKKHLLAGPVTVLENSSYAGDARIDDVPPGQNRFISYGIDLNVLVDSDGQEEGRVPNAIRSAKISQGVLEVVTRRQLSQTYKVQNKGDVAKTVIIEHPRMPDWHVVEPAKEEETTEDVHRLRLRVEPHKTQSLVVRTEGDSTSRTEILTSKVDDLVFYTRDGVLPSNVRTGLQKAVVLKAALTDTQSQIDQRKKEIADVTAEQQRLRENMKTVAQNTEYYTRLLTKLNDQETHIEQLQKEIAEAVKTQTKQKKELEEYISKLEL